MGFIILSPKSSEIVAQIKSVRHQNLNRNGKLQIQGLIIQFCWSKNIGFVYCRSSPFTIEVKKILNWFQECHILMGDINLSYKSPTDQKKLDIFRSYEMKMLLKEITRRLTDSQLDHIFVKEGFEKFCYATSYFNFISDHNSIVIRIGNENNLITQEAKERIYFSEDMHLKNIDHSKEGEETRFDASLNTKDIEENVQNCEQFKRRILNPDASSCWLNACLQLLSTALEHVKQQHELNS